MRCRRVFNELRFCDCGFVLRAEWVENERRFTTESTEDTEMAESEALQHKRLTELEMQWRRRQEFTAPEAAVSSLRSFFRKVRLCSGHKMRSCLFSMSCGLATVILCSSVYRVEFSKLDARSSRLERSVETSWPWDTELSGTSGAKGRAPTSSNHSVLIRPGDAEESLPVLGLVRKGEPVTRRAPRFSLASVIG
jgi:hypothetical protein